MKLRYKFIYQPVGDVTLAIAVGEDAKDYNGIVNLNETGIEIMKYFENDMTVDEVVGRLQQEYDADEPTLRKAVEEIVKKLEKDNLLA